VFEREKGRKPQLYEAESSATANIGAEYGGEDRANCLVKQVGRRLQIPDSLTRICGKVTTWLTLGPLLHYSLVSVKVFKYDTEPGLVVESHNCHKPHRVPTEDSSLINAH
jgi:hypothetical protein